ncbi:MAG: radical SAM protein [Methanoregulaceae archaeon]|nr:radical SAM protein [Methanoregulaceae archaeon]
MTLMDGKIKADLLSIGTVDVEASLLPAPRTSTAGPGMGLQSIFFASGGLRVRLEVNRDSPLRMERKNGHVVIVRDHQELVDGDIEEVVAHCPDQVYITISERCIYNCQFCSVPVSQGKIKTREEILAIVEKAKKSGRLKVIALTSGIATSPEDEIDRVVDIVRALAPYKVPIGVAVHPAKHCSRRLKDAGVTEVKYSVETMDPEIFDRVCRGRKGHTLDFILDSLRDAVQVFGRNHVSTNIIIGLGETDECVRQGVEYLARMGVIPILRPISISPLRKEALKMATRPSPERLLKLTGLTREILEKYGLSVNESRTMCLSCTGCDLTPYHDL